MVGAWSCSTVYNTRVYVSKAQVLLNELAIKHGSEATEAADHWMTACQDLPDPAMKYPDSAVRSSARLRCSRRPSTVLVLSLHDLILLAIFFAFRLRYSESPVSLPTL